MRLAGAVVSAFCAYQGYLAYQGADFVLSSVLWVGAILWAIGVINNGN